MEKYNLTIRIEDEENPEIYTELNHKACNFFSLLALPKIGYVMEQHIKLKEEKIKKLEVTV